SLLPSMLARPPRSTPFPYTTLFRSEVGGQATHALLVERVAFGLFRMLVADQQVDGLDGRHAVPLAHHPGAGLPGQGVERQVASRSEEHTSELQSRENLVCRLLLEKK